ncbi:YopX family protein [Enterococcus mundtii]
MIPKFRAWDKHESVMRDVAVLLFTKSGKINFIEYWKNPSELKSYHVRNIELIQSTGLKDKKDVEIFEGDIIKNSNGLTGYVTYLQQEAGFVVVLKKSDYRLGHRNTGESYTEATNHEVIGNIYENPELLEEVK